MSISWDVVLQIIFVSTVGGCFGCLSGIAVWSFVEAEFKRFRATPPPKRAPLESQETVDHRWRELPADEAARLA